MFGDITGQTKEELIKKTRMEHFKQRLKEIAPPLIVAGILLGITLLVSMGDPQEIVEDEESYIPVDPEMLRKVREDGATYVYWIDENDVAHHSVIYEDGTDA